MARQFTHHPLINVAPHPALARFDGADQRMLSGAKMFRSMLVLRGVTAANLPASEAHSQVDPRITHPHAFFTNMLRRLRDPDFIGVRAFRGHLYLLGIVSALS